MHRIILAAALLLLPHAAHADGTFCVPQACANTHSEMYSRNDTCDPANGPGGRSQAIALHADAHAVQLAANARNGCYVAPREHGTATRFSYLEGGIMTSSYAGNWGGGLTWAALENGGENGEYTYCNISGIPFHNPTDCPIHAQPPMLFPRLP